MKKYRILAFFFSFIIFTTAQGQSAFVHDCLGTWKGTMYIYSNGKLKDSVRIKFVAAKTQSPDTWSWRTEYQSVKIPMVKDYLLRLRDPAIKQFVVDEGNGVELNGYVVENKMYHVFETAGITLTSTYERLGNHLIFEVTAGKKLEGSVQGVTRFSVDTVQRVVLVRE